MSRRRTKRALKPARGVGRVTARIQSTEHRAHMPTGQELGLSQIVSVAIRVSHWLSQAVGRPTFQSVGIALGNSRLAPKWYLPIVNHWLADLSNE